MRQQLEHHIRSRDYAAALAVSRVLYSATPSNGEIAAMHGHVLVQLGQSEEARPVLEHAAVTLPKLPSVWIDLANACIAGADWRAAADAVSRFRAMAPNSSAGIFADAEVQLGMGRRERAQGLFHRATNAHENFLKRRLALAGKALDAQQFELADWHYQGCIAMHPDAPQAQLDYLASLFQQQRYEEAATAARAALQRWPESVKLLQRFSIILDQFKCDLTERVAVRSQWLRYAPDSVDAHVALANALLAIHDFENAHRHWRLATTLDPAQPLARWNALHYPHQALYRAEQDITAFRQRWQSELAHFEQSPLPDNSTCLRLIESCGSLFIVYTDQQVPEALRQRARVLTRMCDALLATPIDTAALPASPTHAGRRRRVGIVSSNFSWHSVSRVWGELMLAVDRSELELICFNVSSPEDSFVEEWRRRADGFVEPQTGLFGWHQCLRSAELDILIFLDLGPEKIVQALATRRYAPVQCTTWAFPVTSGLATIDYFLSSDLMEPEPLLAQSHYFETLIRLPGLACSYAPLLKQAEDAAVVPVFGGLGSTRFLCAQAHPKLLPMHDDLFARIVAGLPHSVLTLSHSGNSLLDDALRARIEPRLRAHGVDTQRCLELRPQMPFLDFAKLLAQTDVMLDSLHFSGCLTSLDALTMDIPIVTLPGETMRSRQTAAMLTLLELPELIASDQDDYVRIAIELGHNAPWRAEIRQSIRERKHRLYDFKESARGLTDFLRTVQPRC